MGLYPQALFFMKSGDVFIKRSLAANKIFICTLLALVPLLFAAPASARRFAKITAPTEDDMHKFGFFHIVFTNVRPTKHFRIYASNSCNKDFRLDSLRAEYSDYIDRMNKRTECWHPQENPEFKEGQMMGYHKGNKQVASFPDGEWVIFLDNKPLIHIRKDDSLPLPALSKKPIPIEKDRSRSQYPIPLPRLHVSTNTPYLAPAPESGRFVYLSSQIKKASKHLFSHAIGTLNTKEAISKLNDEGLDQFIPYLKKASSIKSFENCEPEVFRTFTASIKMLKGEFQIDGLIYFCPKQVYPRYYEYDTYVWEKLAN